MPHSSDPPRGLAVGIHQRGQTFPLVAHARQQMPQPRRVNRFGQVVERTQLDGLNRRVDGAVGGHQNNLALRLRLAHGAEDVQPVDLRHPQIDDGEIGRFGLEPQQPLAGAGIESHLVPGGRDHALDQPQHPWFVVNDHKPERARNHVEELRCSFRSATAAVAAL